MRLRAAVRTGLVSMAMLGLTGLGVAGMTTAYASSGAQGSYSITFTWSGETPQTSTLTLMAHHKFTDGGGASGTYKYKGHHLTFKYPAGCGAKYTGTGTPSAGFSGTMVIKNGGDDCLPKGTTGTWSSGAVGSGSLGTVTTGVSAAGRR